MLCTVKDVKDRLGLTAQQTAADAVIAGLIAGFGAMADRLTDRTLLATSEMRVEYITGGAELIQVGSYPVIEVESVEESLTGDWADSAALAEGTDWRLLSEGRAGVFMRLGGRWTWTLEGIKIVYRGGYAEAADPATEEPPGGEGGGPQEPPQIAPPPMPADLREAAIKQCVMEFQRRDDLGVSGASFEGGGFNKFTDMQLLPAVRATLESYRRVRL